jgi:plastocyanin
MDSQHSAHDGGEHGGEIHMPDPSIWPLFVGFAALVVGAALVWWSNDRSNNFAGPLVGAAIVLALVSAAGWAWEDSRMKRKHEEGDAARRREARYTQVVTFVVVEGALERARGAGGVIEAIDQSDLRDLNGFQDLRIIVSPATAGPSQVLVETTWSAREGLDSYEGTRQTLLDVVNAHSDEVLAGSIQVFDMEVVRDTKDASFSFGWGTATALIGSLVVGGFMVGAGLNLFKSSEKAVAAGPTGPSAPLPGTVIATDNKFNVSTLEAPPNTDVTFTFTNNGKAKHNLHFFDKKDGNDLAPGASGDIIDGGKTVQISFKTPGAGSYYFHCDVHPDQMFGTFTVKDGAPVPGAAAAAPGGGPPGGLAVTATDNKFDKTTLNAPAGGPVTVAFSNKGKSKHNIHFLDKKDGKDLAPGATADIIDGGKTVNVTFTPPGPGTFYYQCDVHPDEMNGTLAVK